MHVAKPLDLLDRHAAFNQCLLGRGDFLGRNAVKRCRKPVFHLVDAFALVELAYQVQ
jgi:hypothetical protein